MKIKEIHRKTSSTSVVSKYSVNSQTINLVSTFNNQVSLEDLIYQVILNKLRTSEISQDRDVQEVKDVV